MSYNRYNPQYEENRRIWCATNIWYIDGPGRFIQPPPPSIKYDPESLPITAPATSTPVSAASPDTPVTPDTPLKPVTPASPPSDEKVSVINEDTFAVASLCRAEGLNPMILNMANATQPGGGVYKGCMAQEEDLFRRSDYFLAAASKHYPLKPLEVLYSPRITVYLDKQYALLPEVESYACLACAAERDPKTVPNPVDPENTYNRLYESDEMAQITRKKILMIFRVGIEQGHDCLVLGSLGCGAFNNPQMRIIEYFNEGIRDYGAYFRKIVFAVLSKGDPNFDLFDEHIERNNH